MGDVRANICSACGKTRGDAIHAVSLDWKRRKPSSGQHLFREPWPEAPARDDEEVQGGAI